MNDIESRAKDFIFYELIKVIDDMNDPCRELWALDAMSSSRLWMIGTTRGLVSLGL